MGYTAQLLDDVRSQLAPDDAALKEARERRDLVRRAAEFFLGGRRSFASGSLAHATANCPIHERDKGLDADSGVVLDRNYHPGLGPDSALGGGPVQVVRDMCAHVSRRVLAKYPKATFEITKRAILVSFHEPLPSGEDPTVDLVLGLDRRGAPGLWIPNTEADRWDPSDPEKHTALLTAEPKALRVVRARAIRLAKAENKRTATAPLCSFNIEALGLMFVQPGMGEPAALLALWELGARDLQARLTPDPAGVSADIKVVDCQLAIARLTDAGRRLSAALARDTDERWVREQLRPLWPDFIAETGVTATKARTAAHLKSRSPLSVTATGALSTGGGFALKQPRAFGAPRPR
jgi:hypothetical protein